MLLISFIASIQMNVPINHTLLNTTDIIILILIAIFFIMGWRKGFLQSLIGPIALGVWTILGIMHYDLTKNFLTALLLVVGGTMASSLLTYVIMRVASMDVNKQDQGYVFIGSRIAGSLLSMLWKGSITLIILMIITILPTEKLGMAKIQNDINLSLTYKMSNLFIINRNQYIQSAILAASLFKHPEYIQNLSTRNQYQEFVSHPKIRDIKDDPELSKYISNNDIAKIISHPKILALIKDDKLMKQLGEVGVKLYAETAQKDKADKE